MRNHSHQDIRSDKIVKFIILAALLTSNLTAYLNAQRAKPWLQSIEDLRMCRKIDCHRIGILEGSQHEEYFRKEVVSGYQMNYYHLKHPDECYTKLLDGHIDVALADSSSADYFTQTSAYCQLEIAHVSFAKTYYGIAVPKGWRYKQDLDNHIMDLKTNNELDQLLEKWFQQKICDHEDENNGFGEGLAPPEVIGLFYIFLGFTVINILIFISKQLDSWWKSRNPKAGTTSTDEQNQSELTPIGNRDTESPVDRNSLTHIPATENTEETRL